MKLIEDNIWNHKLDVVGFTANNVVRDGKLVMGAGFAKEVKLRYPSAVTTFGNLIENSPYFGCVFSFVNLKPLFAFQTKYHYAEDSNLGIIKLSTKKLKDFANVNKNMSIGLNYPGVGLGNLEPEDVFEIIKYLPDNVKVFKL